MVGKILGLCEGVHLTHIEKTETRLDGSTNHHLVADGKIEVDDAEALGPRLHEPEHRRSQHMNAREGETLAAVGIEVVVDRPYLACLHVGPAHEPHVVVEKQVAARLALTHEQGGIISGAIVEGTQVGIAEDVDVMHEHRTVGIEERSRLLLLSCPSQKFIP